MTTGTDTSPVIIIGRGCAGLAAAAVLSRAGVEVLIIDEAQNPGGQLLRGKWPSQDLASRFDRSKGKGFALVKDLDRSKVRVMSCTRVCGIFPGHTLLVSQKTAPGKERIREIKSPRVILATGARERFLPFKGWTLPGVMSCGAAQILIKTHGVLPARATLIAGTSPLQMVLASQILMNRGRVSGLLSPAPFSRGLDILRHLPHAAPKILEGMAHQIRLLGARVPVKFRTAIVEARGTTSLEAVVTVRLDHEGHPVQGTEETCHPGALALGHGFVPNLELAAQAGCALAFDEGKGGWAVKTDDALKTSVPGIFAAGELTGIAGGSKSLIEGEMAALSILGRPTADLVLNRKKELDFGSFLNRFCRIPKPFWHQVPDDTIICRCEEITMGDIRRAIANGFHTAVILKKATRAGMGHCQGRTCGPMILDILSALAPVEGLRTGMPVSRAPVKPMAIRPFLRGD